jgi:rhamnose utilization protein RhaD (predicted bifunctional aldolase and dehydrogenase)/NAD(P)-dependent dehydrogenase (short-subunit alcohol dehydrogenase family)
MIEELIEISHYYGKESRYVIAGGGNTSYKSADKLWVKASGFSLATIGEEGFAVLDREKLKVISEKTYPQETSAREEAVKNDLSAACITKDRRPSVETSMHNAIGFSYVVHLHPTAINGIMCSQQVAQVVGDLFGENSIYIPYVDPGYILFKEVERQINIFKSTRGYEPHIILLQNHGIFVGADTTAEIKNIYNDIFSLIDKKIQKPLPYGNLKISSKAVEIIPAIRMLLSRESLKTLKIRNTKLISYFIENNEHYSEISTPFSPDIIVYCKSNYIYLSSIESAEETITDAKNKIEAFTAKFGYQPKVILIKDIGLVAIGDHAANCDTILDVYEDMMKIAWLSHSFGGSHPMTKAQIEFIDNWEVENYRRKVSADASSGRVKNKTIIVTGAAQGFGEGIARCLFKEGANIVVADLNETVGQKTANSLNAIAKNNRTLFVKTNVAEIQSLEALMLTTVSQFGGIDVFISNAGVLRAGGLEEMTPEIFDFVTKINYNAYFYCTKVVSQVMKLQSKYAPNYFADIIQINSKSGLRGSKANFAYSGGKFGGIGLTQSFALELAPFRIKVNSICPGNFYEGPLWSDPENGLFVQYLKAGKVPSAKTVEDVRKFYMAQVPMHKGCSPEDVTKGALYLIDQTCETGQALPITGGQVMLS